MPAADVPLSVEKAKSAAAAAGEVDLLPTPADEKPTFVAPTVYVSTVPTELVQTDGKPKMLSIAGTQLLEVSNSDTAIFLDLTSQTYYLLISGRWFSSKSLEAGPWAYVVGKDLPADFAEDSRGRPEGQRAVSVPGTPQAKEAAIATRSRRRRPSAATRRRSPSSTSAPDFVPVVGAAPLRYAANTPVPVIEVRAGEYYAVQNGVWFTARRRPPGGGRWRRWCRR